MKEIVSEICEIYCNIGEGRQAKLFLCLNFFLRLSLNDAGSCEYVVKSRVLMTYGMCRLTAER